jgi:four helix bundle protein
MKMTPERVLERLSTFAQCCRNLTARLPRNTYNTVYSSQLIRSSSSPGANYIEAIEASSSKEFCLRLKISRKELKESTYWLSLIKTSNTGNALVVAEGDHLIKESEELVKIFAAAIITSEKNQKIEKIKK